MHKTVKTVTALLTLLMLLMGYATAQTPITRQKARASAGQSTVEAAAGGATSVTGGGTADRLVKWTSQYTLGDSTITEDKFGKVGIGTTAPTSLLTVNGMIQTTLGGLKFPDGTVQTSAAIGLASISHNATLTGDGTSGAPLGVAVPLSLTGATSLMNGQFPILTVFNTFPKSGIGLYSEGWVAIQARGQNNTDYAGGFGIQVDGGTSSTSFGGDAVIANGGGSTNGNGGSGMRMAGGTGSGNGHHGGDGVHSIAGGGVNGATSGRAGFFQGAVEITGTLSKGGGSFKIDHPLDPENKYLYHSFVESPDMKNIYDGNVTTDESGEAVVQMPDYFEALNRDFRYQLTVIGTFAQAIIAEKIKGNRFVIKTNAANTEVSWQVTGIRRDAWANKNRIPVEETKAEKERGFYLHPEAFNQPAEKNVEWVKNPDLMKQVKELRDKQP